MQPELTPERLELGSAGSLLYGEGGTLASVRVSANGAAREVTVSYLITSSNASEADAPASEAGAEPVEAGAEPVASESTASESTAQDAAKKEEEIIDEAAEFIEKNRIGTIKTKHDGLVQQNDVFTNSLGRTPGGRGSDRGVSRDVF